MDLRQGPTRDGVRIEFGPDGGIVSKGRIYADGKDDTIYLTSPGLGKYWHNIFLYGKSHIFNNCFVAGGSGRVEKNISKVLGEDIHNRFGGAFEIYDSNTKITGSQITSNKADIGGAIFSVLQQVYIVDNEIHRNRAEVCGAGYFFRSTGDVLDNKIFINFSDNIPGMFFRNCNIRIMRNYFNQNGDGNQDIGALIITESKGELSGNDFSFNQAS